jgi:hypothetical protein
MFPTVAFLMSSTKDKYFQRRATAAYENSDGRLFKKLKIIWFLE